ncbi:hypothetical protein R6Z07F_018045 [Ovis aries]
MDASPSCDNKLGVTSRWKDVREEHDPADLCARAGAGGPTLETAPRREKHRLPEDTPGGHPATCVQHRVINPEEEEAALWHPDGVGVHPSGPRMPTATPVAGLPVTAAISRVYRVHSSAPKGLECQACILGLPECRRGQPGVTCQAPSSLLCVKA